MTYDGFNNKYFRQNVLGFFSSAHHPLHSALASTDLIVVEQKCRLPEVTRKNGKTKFVRILVLNLMPESILLYKRRKGDGQKNNMQKLPDYD